MGHYFLKIIWYNFDLHVICGLYCSSTDKSLTLVKDRGKLAQNISSWNMMCFHKWESQFLRDPSCRHTCMWHLACFISWRGAITELWISLVQYVFTLIQWHRKQWYPAGHITLHKCSKLPQTRYTLQIASTPDPKWPLIFLPVESPLTTRSKSVWSETTILIKK
jgi:hypothetical protein